MKLSIIIPNYNGERYLIDCLESLKSQTFKDYEVLLVDNGSSDKSCDTAVKIMNDIIIIKLDKNYGFSKAVNVGIKAAKARYVVLLNNDTIAEKEWLEKLYLAISEDNSTFSVCSKMIQYHNTNNIDDAGDEYCLLGWAYKRGDGTKIDSYVVSERVFSSCAGATVYDSKKLDEIGYFDENFFAYLEDVDISYRANIAGYKNIYCADAKILHIGSATSGSKYNDFKIRLTTRNNIFLTYKNMPLPQLIINIPFLFLGWIIKAIFFSAKGFSRSYFQGTKDGILSISKIRKTKLKIKNLPNYFYIEYKLVINTIKYILSKLVK